MYYMHNIPSYKDKENILLGQYLLLQTKGKVLQLQYPVLQPKGINTTGTISPVTHKINKKTTVAISTVTDKRKKTTGAIFPVTDQRNIY